jgi:hypothetical protein
MMLAWFCSELLDVRQYHIHLRNNLHQVISYIVTTWQPGQTHQVFA